MAKLKDSPIQLNDLKEYLSGQDDFQLEIAAFQACKKRNLEVFHGGTYEDPVSKKSRQFDIRASIRKETCTVHLAVECKSLKDNFPLLVSRLPRMQEEAFHEIVYSHPRAEGLHSLIGSNYYSISVFSPNTIYEKDKCVGKSTTQVGKDSSGKILSGDSEIYDKWSQAVASAFDLVSNSTNDFERNDKRFALSVILPVLVLNEDMLWVADYTSDGLLVGDPKRVDSCDIFIGKSLWTGPMGIGYTFSHLNVFTLHKFEGYLDGLIKNDNYWNLLFPIEEIMKKIEEKDNE